MMQKGNQFFNAICCEGMCCNTVSVVLCADFSKMLSPVSHTC